MSVVFTKTAKGVDEMSSRAAGLSPRVRRVLIMVDGKRTVDEIRDMVNADDLSHSLGLLEESGFIELLQMATAQLPDRPSDGGFPSTTMFREVPAQPNSKEMEMARNFIMNTLKTFCGPATHLSIIEKTFAAKTHEELRAQFEPWFAAISETRDGRRRAEELRAQLLKVI